MNGSTELGAIPANESENIRPTVTAGFAKDVELVNQYAAPMYAPTAAADRAARPVRASAKITAISPAVATTSPMKWPAVNRSLVEISNAVRSNMTFARTAPMIPPDTCAAAYATTDPIVIREPARRSSSQSAADTTGLKCAPDTGPNSRISTERPNAVAIEFSSSCNPASLGDSCAAAIPEPTTTVTNRAVPTNSAITARNGALILRVTPSAARSTGAERRGVGQDGVDLPLFVAWTRHPHLVLGGKATRCADLFLGK